MKINKRVAPTGLAFGSSLYHSNDTFTLCVERLP